jgi:hypothetical protein
MKLTFYVTSTKYVGSIEPDQFKPRYTESSPYPCPLKPETEDILLQIVIGVILGSVLLPNTQNTASIPATSIPSLAQPTEPFRIHNGLGKTPRLLADIESTNTGEG